MRGTMLANFLNQVSAKARKFTTQLPLSWRIPKSMIYRINLQTSEKFNENNIISGTFLSLMLKAMHCEVMQILIIITIIFGKFLLHHFCDKSPQGVLYVHIINFVENYG